MPFDLSPAHKYNSVDAYQTKTIFLYQVPAHVFAAIKYIYCNYYGQGDYFTFYLDGVDVQGIIEREIGSPNLPMKCDPPYIARKEIRWEAYNGYSSTLIFEVINIGTLYEEEIYPI